MVSSTWRLRNENGIAVLLGNGDGTFQPLTNWALPNPFQGGTISPTVLTIGDFNNDGNADIAAGSFDAGAIFVFLGNGDGSFQTPPVGSLIAGGAGAVSLTTADFNSDDNLDVATGQAFSQNNVVLALGNGKGFFTTDAFTVVNNSAAATSVIATDLNGDGFPDLVVWSYNGSVNDAVTILLNCGLRCTNTAVTPSMTTAAFNQPVTFTAKVTPANAKATLAARRRSRSRWRRPLALRARFHFRVWGCRWARVVVSVPRRSPRRVHRPRPSSRSARQDRVLSSIPSVIHQDGQVQRCRLHS